MPVRAQSLREDPVSGREIILAYVKLKPLAVAKYNQLHKALDLFDTWDTQSKIGFLSQFLDLADILGSDCAEIVSQFCRLNWSSLPSTIRKNFVDFLASLAIFHISHVESILKSVTRHFIPELKIDPAEKSMRPSLSAEDQEEIYGLAHHCLEHIISCCPRYSSSLKKCCAVNFPHFRHPTLKIMGFIRNLIILSEQFSHISQELWSMIIDRMVDLDTASSGKTLFEFDHIFQKVSNQELPPEKLCPGTFVEIAGSIDIEVRLDLCMAMVLAYLLPDKGSKTEFLGELLEERNFKWLLATSSVGNIFGMLLKGFEEHVVSTFNVHSVSFLWFYLAGISEDNSRRMLQCLWGVVVTARSPNEWEKSQHAAAFLGGYLAQASYITLSTAHIYLKKMLRWCFSYLKNLPIKSTARQLTCVEHGLFYATIQAVLFVVCYRWKELNEDEGIKLYLQKKLMRVLLCDLNPLRCVSHVVVHTFEKVNRYLQIVERSFIKEAKESLRVVVTESYFPFSFCAMKICSPRFQLFMRQYVPCEKRKKKRSAIVQDGRQEPEKKLRRK